MLFIWNAQIYPMAEQLPEKIEKGCIAVQGSKILRIGNDFTYEDICREYPRDEKQRRADILLDARGNLVMPGLIEAHCHMGITEEKKGMEGDDCNETVHPITPELRAIDAINTMDAA